MTLDWCIPQEGIKYKTVKPLAWEIGAPNSLGCTIHVTPPFRFEVSIPWVARWKFSPHDPRYLRAACIHDFLLAAGWSRPTAGGVFEEVLEYDGVGKLERRIMWRAVVAMKWG